MIITERTKSADYVCKNLYDIQNYDMLIMYILAARQTPDTKAYLYEKYFPLLDDTHKYQLALAAYHVGNFASPSLFENVKHARLWGSPELPPEWNELEIIVYRAGPEPIDEAKYHFSWSLSLEFVEHFREWKSSSIDGKSRHIFQAKIRCKDIIGIMSYLGSKEIVQYNSVYDVQMISE